MYRIIIVDLDGTLLSSDNKVTEYTKEIIHLLLEKKIFFIFASGRHYIDIIKIRDFLKIKVFIIASNGSKIYDLDSKLIFSSHLDENIAFKLCKIAFLEKDITTQIYQNNSWYINNNKIENKFCSSFSSLKYKFFNLNNFKFNNISKVFFTSKNFKKLYLFEKKIIKNWKDKFNINFSEPGCLEIVSTNVSKGYGLKFISNLLGISLKQCIAFGNGMNDLDMLSISGKSYIMKNADFQLKKALPNIEIIESNNDDGIARCLEKIFIK